MLRHSEFLTYRPSQIAAASLVYAINSLCSAEKSSKLANLGIWTREVEQMTQVVKTEDLQPVYSVLKEKICSPDWV